MPGKTGKVCLKEIRSNRKFKDVPIVMFSTSSHPPDVKESYEDGANLYVSKSVFFEDDARNLKKILAINWDDYMPRPSSSRYLFK